MTHSLGNRTASVRSGGASNKTGADARRAAAVDRRNGSKARKLGYHRFHRGEITRNRGIDRSSCIEISLLGR
ncbi:MAG: hypothetical protein ACREP1_10085 [Rhodanobacteraceae bacterium]